MGRHCVGIAGNAWMGRVCVALTLVAAMGGCDAEDPESFQWREGTVAHERPTSVGGFINNGLHDPEVGGIDPDHPLTSNSGLKPSKLDDDPARLATARYVVECALPEGESVVKNVAGVVVELEGALGLAPEWQDSDCDEECQEWVSACVIARTNVSGTTVPLWLTGDHPALGFTTTPTYSTYEASFFGNLFASPNQAYVCPASEGEGAVLAQLQGRTCSNESGGWCGFTSYSNCLSDRRRLPRGRDAQRGADAHDQQLRRASLSARCHRSGRRGLADRCFVAREGEQAYVRELGSSEADHGAWRELEGWARGPGRNTRPCVSWRPWLASSWSRVRAAMRAGRSFVRCSSAM
jgi:hypothetical protein